MLSWFLGTKFAYYYASLKCWQLQKLHLKIENTIYVVEVIVSERKAEQPQYCHYDQKFHLFVQKS